MDMGLDIPMGLGGRTVLVLDKSGPRLQKLAPYADGSSTIANTRRVRFEGDTIYVDDAITIGGYYAASMRGFLRSESPNNHTQLLQTRFADIEPSIRVTDVTISGLDSTGGPLVLKTNYHIPKRLNRLEAEGLAAEIPAVWERYYLSAPYLESRTSPFRFPYPVVFDSAVSITPPIGYKASVGRASPVAEKLDFFDWELNAAPDRIGLRFHFHRPSGRHAAERFRGYYDAVQEICDVVSPKIVFTKVAITARRPLEAGEEVTSSAATR
jgi:hypothetical protein